MTKYFDDQPIVRGADVIYRPAGNAGEYAPLATNPYKGCGHGCAYCYVPNATHLDRKVFNAGAILREDYLDRLYRDVVRYKAAGVCDGHPADQVFITFSSDPWHPGDVRPTVVAIELLKSGGMSFCTLSKGGKKALEYIGLYRPDRDAYAASLTSLDGAFSKLWEPNAAMPWDRIETLRRFHEAGIFTWVSLEPTLNADASIAIVKETHEFVDLYKIGKANYVKKVSDAIDWADYVRRVTETCRALDKRHYVKIDLQRYLPPGYDNPLRVPQHH